MFVCFSDIEVACTKYEGVDAVKRALRKGLELSTEAMPIKVCTVQLSSILLHFLFRLYTHVMTKCYFIFLAVHNSVLSIKECNTHTHSTVQLVVILVNCLLPAPLFLQHTHVPTKCYFSFITVHNSLLLISIVQRL